MADWIPVKKKGRIRMRRDVVYKTEIPIVSGKIVVENDSLGNFISATVYNEEAGSAGTLEPCDVTDRLTLNGLPITYISPGSVIIAEGSICYTQRCSDGRTITVCYPRGSCPGVG